MDHTPRGRGLALALVLLPRPTPEPASSVDHVLDPQDGAHAEDAEGLRVAEFPGSLTEDRPSHLHPFSFDATGELHVWAESEGRELQLRLLDANDRVLASTTEGAGRGRPYLGGPTRAGLEFTVEVSSPGGTLPCPYTLHSRTWSDDGASLAAAGVLARELGTIEALAGRGQLEEARERARSAVDDHLDPDHLPAPALRNALRSLGGMAYGLGDLESPIRVGQVLLAAGTRYLPEDHPELVGLRFNLGISLSSATRSEEASPLFESVVASLEAEGDLGHPILHAAALYGAQSKRSMGDTRSAIAALTALEERILAHARDRVEFLASVRTERALAHVEEGELEIALRLLESTLARVDLDELANPNIEVGLREALGLVRYQQGDLAGARPQLRFVVDHLSATLAPDHPRRIDAINNLAGLELLLGHTGSARAALEPLVELVAERPDLPDRMRWTVLLNWCSTLVFLDRPEEALELHRRLESELESSSTTNRLAGTTRLNGARILAECGRFDEALEVTRTLYRGDLDLPFNQRGMEITRESLRFQLEVVAGTRPNAFESLRTIAERIEEHLVEAVLSGSTTLASSAAHTLAESRALAIGGALSLPEHPNRDDLLRRLAGIESYARSSAARARSLARRAERRFEAEELEALRGKWNRANADLAELLWNSAGATPDGTSLLELADRRARAEEALRSALVIEDEAIAPGDLELDGALGPEDTALLFALAARPEDIGSGSGPTQRLSCFVVTPGPSVRLVDMGSLADTRAAIEAWRTHLVRGGPADRGVPPRSPSKDATESDELRLGLEVSRRLIEPLGLDPKGIDRLLLTSLGELHRIPFDAIPWRSGPGDAAPVRLGDLVRIQWVESLDLELGRLATPGPGSVRALPMLALGGIDYGDPQDAVRKSPFRPLPGTERELDVLGSLFGLDEDSPHLLRGLDASRAAFLEEAPRARRLHVATHGWYDPLDRQHAATRSSRPPLLGEQIVSIAPYLTTGLAFAEANTRPDATGPDSGVVLAEDIAHLDLSRCELAVLSACETSLGPIVRGNGLRSLQSALHGAGVRRAVTSIWPVPDRSTALLMESFYRGIVEDSLGPMDALARAKREVRAKHPHPHHWAGWVLSGFAAPNSD